MTAEYVATALTVYGIETILSAIILPLSKPVATALTVYGIETQLRQLTSYMRNHWHVATALTVYGIETSFILLMASTILLQQYLPFTVLKQEEYTESCRVFFSCNSTYRLRY